MSGQRLTLWIIALVAIIAAIGYRMSVMREPPPAPTPKVAFVASGSGPFWQAAINGAKAAAEKDKVELTIQSPQKGENVDEQMPSWARLIPTRISSEWQSVPSMPNARRR
jgi:ABC-type sugar transport system substrate-binding protein